MTELPTDTPQLFLDGRWVVRQQRLTRRWLPAKIFPEPVVRSDRAWEARTLVLYGTVQPQPGGGYRMYYGEFVPHRGREAERAMKVYVAHSDDGFLWEKPDLRLVEWDGSRENNIVLVPDQRQDSPSVIHGPGDSEWPYKLIAFETGEGSESWDETWGLYGYGSRDGLNWEKMPGPLVKAGDRTNLMAEKADGRYVAYTRHPEMFERTGGRTIWRTESEDFLSWTEPRLVLAPDLEDPGEVEFYGMSVFRRHGWFLGLLEYWDSDSDVIEVHLAFSRDGVVWQRPWPREPFICAAHDWNRTWSSCASNGPIIIDEQMVFYFGGRWVSHHYDAAHQQGSIGYASLPIDRFCAIEGGPGGWFETPAFDWPGGDLVVNADTRESFSSHPTKTNGELGVEVLDGAGNPLPGWSGEGKALFHGNTHCRCGVESGEVRWPESGGLDALRGREIRLRFHLRHARLFTFAAATEGRGGH